MAVFSGAEMVFELIRMDVHDWFHSYKEPMKLKVLSQRYSRTLKKMGLVISQVVLNDPYFVVKVDKNGGRLVAPAQDLHATFATPQNFWMNAGVPISKL